MDVNIVLLIENINIAMPSLLHFTTKHYFPGLIIISNKYIFAHASQVFLYRNCSQEMPLVQRWRTSHNYGNPFVFSIYRKNKLAASCTWSIAMKLMVSTVLVQTHSKIFFYFSFLVSILMSVTKCTLYIICEC